MQSEDVSALAVRVDYGVALRAAFALDDQVNEWRRQRRTNIEHGRLDVSASCYRHLCEAKSAARHLRAAKPDWKVISNV